MIARMAMFLVLGEIYVRLNKELVSYDIQKGWASGIAFLMLAIPLAVALVAARTWTWLWP